MSKGTIIVLVVVGCILLAIGNVALWAAHDVFNAERFGENVAEGLQSDASVQALAGPIVDRILVDYPDFSVVLRGPAEEIVTWMLQRPVFTVVFKETAEIASKAMTTSAEDVVGIDIAGVISNAGSSVTGVISAIDPDAGDQVQTALDSALDSSDRLAIYEEGRFPKLRQLSNVMPWLGLLAALGAVVLFVVTYLRAEDQHEALKYTGWGIMITAVLAFMLFVPVIQGVAQNNIADPVMAAVVGAVVSALARGYAVQSLLIFLIGLVVLIVDHHRNRQAEQASASPAA